MKIFNTKLYILEEMTQEDLNNLALERNTLAKENARLKDERKQIKEYVEKCNFDNAEILYDFGSEYCYIDDFKEHILEMLKDY